MLYQQVTKFFLLIILTSSSYFARTEINEKNCKRTFLSGLEMIDQVTENVSKDQQLHSRFMDPKEEHDLQEKWSQTPSASSFLDFALPNDVHYIDHQLAFSESKTAVKIKEKQPIMAKASYYFNDRAFTTNVSFSSDALLSNIRHIGEPKKWLIGTDASAVILFLHGMGLKSNGAHVAKRIFNDVNKHFENVQMLSLDLSWHAEGHREVLSDLKEEVMLLSAFVTKYIPPNVPLFVWGHSGGTILAQQLMTMTDEVQKSDFFHPNLQGIMLFSPVIDAAPGKSVKEKYEATVKGQKKGLSKLPEQVLDPLEIQLFEDFNFLGELYFVKMITQLNHQKPSDKGRYYKPSLMAVGTGDPLVFTGFPVHLFQDYYDPLENMETHYLDQLPLVNTGEYEKVGHVIGRYKDPSSGLPADIMLAKQFMEKQLGINLDPVSKSNTPPILNIIGNFSNDLAFRLFVDQFRVVNAQLNPSINTLLHKTIKGKIRNKVDEILQKYNITNLHFEKTLRTIFSNINSKQLLELLYSLSLPNSLIEEITEYIKQTGYFEIKQIAEGMYLPTENNLLKRGLINIQETANTKSLLTKLSNELAERTYLSEERSALMKNASVLKKLRNKHANILNLVRNKLKIISNALKEASKKPPSSLTFSFNSIRNEAKRLETLADNMVELFTGLSVQMTAPYSLSQIHHLVKQHQGDIDHFQQLYNQYSRNRQHLKKQIIQSISKGEMGSKYQQAVLEIYGPNLDGQGSLYLELKKISQELNQMMIRTYQIDILYTESLMRSQDIFEQLFLLLKPVEKESADWIDIARNGYIFNDTSIHTVLNSMDAKKKLETDQYELFFQNLLNTWKQWKSISIPDLPI